MGIYSKLKTYLKITKTMKTKRLKLDEQSELSRLDNLHFLDALPTVRPQNRLKKLQNYSFSLLAVMILSTLVLGSSFTSNIVRADSISDQIKALQQENANNSNIVANLQSQATSYQDAINRLLSQISSLQGQIANSIAKQNDLQQQIVANQAELARQRATLGDSIKMMYVDGQPSTMEMLASSQNLSEFVDKEEYRTTVNNQIQSTLKKIAELQNKLNAQKQEVEALLVQQQSQQRDLTAAKAEQSNLLAYNQSQQDAYSQKTQANQAKINDLIAQQRRANDVLPASGYYFLRFSGTIKNHDVSVNDYPYANYGFSMSTTPCSSPPASADSADEWGYCTRQCVSYAAWAVQRSGRTAPRYYGNAKDWVVAAQQDGVPIYTDPQPGDVAISTSGTWGHAMYVEQVSGNQIFVSQYNQQLTGQYSTQWRAYK